MEGKPQAKDWVHLSPAHPIWLYYYQFQLWTKLSEPIYIQYLPSKYQIHTLHLHKLSSRTPDCLTLVKEEEINMYINIFTFSIALNITVIKQEYYQLQCTVNICETYRGLTINDKTRVKCKSFTLCNMYSFHNHRMLVNH